MIAQLICFTLGLVMIGFGLFIGIQADQTVGILLMFGGIAQTVYSFGVGE
mgnify:CR=1 FL=1|tara:strand:+ start:169 stop:318 length:150 start_codon:yes stop_codon:yes gene_type:complete